MLIPCEQRHLRYFTNHLGPVICSETAGKTKTFKCSKLRKFRGILSFNDREKCEKNEIFAMKGNV